MTPQDLRILCTALGFTAVVMKGGENQKESARRALGFANLIEAFCNYTIPQLGAAINENEAYQLDETIERLKADLRTRGEADMQKSRHTLFRLYDRLRQRYAAYADDDMLADRVLELLDAELQHDSGSGSA